MYTKVDSLRQKVNVLLLSTVPTKNWAWNLQEIKETQESIIANLGLC